MDLNEIYVFSKVVEHGSFTKASEFLGIPKSRISRNVASLERELGVQLLYRTTRQIELTPAGKKYFQKCSNLFHELDSLNSEISSFSDDIQGLIAITAPEDIATRFLPRIASDFMLLNPRVRFDFYLTGRRVDLIKEPVDLALRIGKLQDSTLKARKIGELSSILVATPHFISRHKVASKIDDLNDLPKIGFGNLGKANPWVLIQNKREHTIIPNVNLMTNSMDMLLHLILENKGVGLLPTFIAREYLMRGELQQILPGAVTPALPIHFVTAPQKEIPLKVKKFMDFAAEKLAQDLI